ncbi:MAG: hypothetical protein J7647_19070 [Cyanobacteria bacterium SBLK]|nr:hypothetical protein [Cyanobacteria bacterium SBLK]
MAYSDFSLETQRFNDREDNAISTIYGCVTTGEDWQFLQLAGDRVLVDERRDYINEIEKVLGIFQSIIDNSFNIIQI